MAKSAREIMEILEAFDLTRCAWSAAQLVGCDPKTITADVAVHDVGADPMSGPAVPAALIRSWPSSRSWWTARLGRSALMWPTTA